MTWFFFFFGCNEGEGIEKNNNQIFDVLQSEVTYLLVLVVVVVVNVVAIAGADTVVATLEEDVPVSVFIEP